MDFPAAADSQRVSAVIHAIGGASLPIPTVEAVIVSGAAATVHLCGSNGLRATVHFRREGAHWRVQAAEAA